jgi:hemolysin III
MQKHLGDWIANSVSHGVGFGLAIAGTILLIIRANTWLEISAVLIYGVSLILLYLFSTLHHALPTKKESTYHFFKSLDMIAIYFLIAGTYTPFLWLVADLEITNTLLIGLWGIALFGTALKLLVPRKMIYVHVILYVLMGWSIVLIWPSVSPLIPTSVLWLVFLGGLSYTLGIIFYVLSYVKKNWHYVHLVWHLMVLLASVLHYFAVYQLI